jgi:ABC-type sugar transport system permease subunit
LRQKAKKKLIIPFLLPALLLYIGFFIYPATRSLNISVLEWSGFTEQGKFVGFKNFIDITKNEVYRISLLNNIGLFIIGGLLIFSISFFFAAVISPGTRGRGFVRVVLFLPCVIPLVALSLIWNFIYSPSFGLVTGFLKAIGATELAKTAWMGPDLIRVSVLIALVWIYSGFYTIIFMAGVDRIPIELFEAAKIEGANRWQVFFRIVVPMMWDIIVIALVFWVIDAMGQFDFIFMISGGQGLVPTEIWTLPLNIYYKAFGSRLASYQLGQASAMAITLVVVIILFIVTIRRLLSREIVEY